MNEIFNHKLQNYFLSKLLSSDLFGLVHFEVGNSSTNIESQSNVDNNNNNFHTGTKQHLPKTKNEEQHIPIVQLTRIMRRALPSHVKISDGAKESIQLCLSEFMSIITSEASERCKIEHRKIVTANDLIWAMDRLGFEDYVGPLVFYLQRYRNYVAQLNDMPITIGFDKDGSGASGSNNGSDNVHH